MDCRIEGNTTLAEDKAVTRVGLSPGEFNQDECSDIVSGTGRSHKSAAAPLTPARLLDDLDMSSAGGFLAAHHVPIVGPEMGAELIKVVRRLQAVAKVYPLPPTVEAYLLALYLILQVAVEHQVAFCARLEKVLGGD